MSSIPYEQYFCFFILLFLMPCCRECCPKLAKFPTIRALCIHLQLFHKISICGPFRCGEENCLRKFDQINSFKKHLKRDHSFDSPDNFDPSVSCESQSKVPSLNSIVSTSSGLNEEIFVNAEEVDLKSFEDILKHDANVFVASLYSKPGVPRNFVQHVVDNVQTLFGGSTYMSILKSTCLDALLSTNCDQPKINEIVSMFDALEHPFDHLHSEHVRLQYFEKCGFYIAPSSHELGKRLVQRVVNGVGKGVWTKVTAQHISLPAVLQKFFELPDAFDAVVSTLNYCKMECDCLINFVQGEIWHKKLEKYGSSDIVVPLFVYFDDFESNDPLGPHSAKIGGIYVSLPCLPPECRSRLENIFVSLLFLSSDREEFREKKLLEPLISDLNLLETQGIDVKTSTGLKKMYFVLGLVVGDNLGMNQLCGFVANFSKAHFPCRYCKMSINNLRAQLEVNVDLLRDKINYENDLLIGDSSLTGIKSECEFNKVESFHITENLQGDLLHEWDEGVIHRTMIPLINHCIASKYFSLQVLNLRIQMFNFGESSNKPPSISEHSLQQTKLKMTGAEMLCFARQFGVLVGDLVPERDEFWNLYISMQRCLDILLCKSLTAASIISYQTLVTELALQYLKLVDPYQFTFKFHLVLCHYQSIMKKSGPLPHLSVRRFESKNGELKKMADVIMSRVNICLSLAIKHQLLLCCRFLSGRSILPETDTGPGDVVTLSEVSNYNSFQNKLPTFSGDELVFTPTWIDYKGTQYKSKKTLALDVDENFGWPVFGQLLLIFVYNETIYFIGKKFETLWFSEHFHGYRVKPTQDYFCVSPNDLLDPFPIHVLTSPGTGEKYAVLKHLI